MDELAEQMVKPSPLRHQGTHDAQGVLVRAGPGTGKTVSLQQLTRLVARRLLATSTGAAPAGRSGASASAVEPGEQSGHGIGLVPMLVSVQRLASYMKQHKLTKGSVDTLLRSYIETEFAGEERDVLLMAYEMRALVCSIDGVDEAAGLKSRIEDLVINHLASKGVRTIVSSRPEGVRLERYSSWVVMDLKPLNDSQQQVAISGQLQNSALYNHLSSLSKLRRGGSADLAAAGGESYSAVASHVASSSPPGVNTIEQIARILDLFDTASVVPVMLSMLVLCLETLTPSTELPSNRLHLYKNSVRASVLRRSASAKESTATGRMLAKVALANHIAQRREFTSVDVKRALTDTAELALWHRLDESTGVPLIKTLETGDPNGDDEAEASKYQFTHLSFQESFFAEGLCAPVVPPDDNDPSTLVGKELASKVHVVWKRGALKLLNDRWLLNTFAICGPLVGPVVANHLGRGLTVLRMTEHQVKSLVALEWEALRGNTSLTSLVLNVGKTVDFSSEKSAGVQTLAALLADSSQLPSLSSIDFGGPVSVGVGAAVHLAEACAHRKGLRLYGKVHCAQFNSLSDADAVLVAATLRSAVGGNVEVAKACMLKDGVRYRIGLAGGTLAEALKASGMGSLPKDLAAHLMLAGVNAIDLRTMLKLSTGELGDLGFTANEIAVSMGSGPPSQAALRELADQGLAMELVATKSLEVTIDDLRKAGCTVPTEEAMVAAVAKAKLESVASLKQARSVDVSKLTLDDAEGAALVWAIALNACPQLSDIVFTKNAFGFKTSSALAQFLRYNRSVKSVDVHENQVDDAGAAIFGKMLSVNGTLLKLRLSDNKIHVAGVETICDGVCGNCTLKHLTMETSSGTQSPGIDVAALKGAVTGESIDFQSRNLGPLSAFIIGKMIDKYRPPVSELALLKNAILKEGAVHIAEMLKNNDDIKVLDLRFCALYPEGMRLICDALQVNTSVETALLLTNSVGQEGARAVDDMLTYFERHSTTMRHLDIQDNLIAPATKDALREKGEKLKIKMIV